jgi:hypothetical protein
MLIELHLRQEYPLPSRAYDCENDDVRSIIHDACQAFGALSEFRVSGFGQNQWPVDVTTDLPIFLEELPSVIRAVQRSMPAEIDFCEQGAERSIRLTPASDSYFAECVSMTTWQPDPRIEKISCKELEEMLLTSKDTFMKALSGMAPELAAHPWIRNWAEGVP